MPYGRRSKISGASSSGGDICVRGPKIVQTGDNLTINGIPMQIVPTIDLKGAETSRDSAAKFAAEEKEKKDKRREAQRVKDQQALTQRLQGA